MNKKKRKIGARAYIGLAMYYICYAIYWLVALVIRSIIKLSTKGKQLHNNVQIKKKRSQHSKSTEYQEPTVIDAHTGTFDKFHNWLLTQKSTIGIILGARGSGKTALGMRVLENMYSKNNRSCYAIGFAPIDIPSWMTPAEKIEDVANGGAVLVDEGGIVFSSRSSMKAANKLFSELLLVSRHKDLSVIFISQNSSNLDINALRQADYLLMKRSSLLQKDFEREKIKNIYADIQEDFKKHDHPGLTYVYSDHFRGFINNSLPGFWSDDVSKSFR